MIGNGWKITVSYDEFVSSDDASDEMDAISKALERASKKLKATVEFDYAVPVTDGKEVD